MALPRLDLLIYAHDGRGLGHASRSIAVGMAFRRLFAERKVLFVSGAAMTPQLIGPAPLDWLKLPAYATKVVEGKSTGIDGLSNFNDRELGALRARTLAHLASLYRPRCVLVDHMPQGKHRELLPAIASTAQMGTRWVLGIRGIVGDVAGVWSELARRTFIRAYDALLWYGDSHVLGVESVTPIQTHFSIDPIETGYVSRMAELKHWLTEKRNAAAPLAGVVSIPWFGEATPSMLHSLADALGKLGDRHGTWRIFLPKSPPSGHHFGVEKLKMLGFCDIAETGVDYHQDLANCRMAVIYGGYNSLTDVMFARTPALVLVRSMQDLEQPAHIRALIKARAGHLIMREESKLQPADLIRDVEMLLTSPPSHRPPNLKGAAIAARKLDPLLSEVS